MAFGSHTHRTALIIGGIPRARLEICRSLERAGYHVTLLRFDERRSFADMSRHCGRSLYLGAVEAGVAGWIERLDALLRKGGVGAVFPLDDMAHELLNSTEQLPFHETRVVGPPASAYRYASDRLRTLELAKSVGLETPPTLRIARNEQAPIPRFPCIVRPARAVAIVDDEPAYYSTKLVRDVNSFDAKLRDDLPRVDVLIQSPEDGDRIDVCLAAVGGELLAVTMARRLDSVGASLVSESPSATIVAAARAFATNLRWTGILRLECVRVGDALVFLDLRCGPGDALALSSRAGVDIPRILLDSLHGRTLRSLAISLPGIRIRYLASGRRRFGSEPHNPPIRIPTVHQCREVRATYLEVERLSDPVPAIAQIVLAGSKLARKALVLWKAVLWGLRGRLAAVQSLRCSDRILFVCKGNINRSMVAEQVLRAKGLTRVASAGLLGMSGRRPSQPAERYINEVVGLPAKMLRSQSIHRALANLADFDLVVCFERRHAVEFLRRNPEFYGRVALLSLLAGGRDVPVDIADPHGGPDEEYERCFDRIARLLMQVAVQPAAGQGVGALCGQADVSCNGH